MTTLTVGAGRNRSLGFVGDWPGNVTPAEYNGEIIISASPTKLVFKNADDLSYYEYVGSFKYTNPSALTMAEVGVSGSVTSADIYKYTNDVDDRKLDLSFKQMTLTMAQLYEAGETGDSLVILFNGNDEIIGSDFNNEANEDGLGNKIKGDVIRAGNGNDIVYGMGGDDSLWGERGNDSLNGGLGNDQLYGGVGNDILESSAGTDTLNGGSGNDTYKLDMSNFVSEKNKITVVDGQGSTDTLNLYDLDDDPDGYNSLPIRINGGNDLAFIYYNESSLNTSDLLGSATAYWIIKDLYKLNTKGNGFTNSIETLNGFDLASPSNGASSILTAAKVTFTINVAGFNFNANSIYGSTKNDALMGYNNQDNLFGGAGNDIMFNVSLSSKGTVTLDGGAGNDQIFDGIGSNILIGGLGVDILNGDDGNDVYTFLSIKDSGSTTATADVIGDGPLADGGKVWNTGDKIDLSAIDANAKIAGDQAFTFWSGASANSVWFDSSTSTVFADASGDAKADFAVVVIGVKSLLAADFIL
jgi:Ca2+-binding RTX toxin-like protein